MPLQSECIFLSPHEVRNAHRSTRYRGPSKTRFCETEWPHSEGLLPGISTILLLRELFKREVDKTRKNSARVGGFLDVIENLLERLHVVCVFVLVILKTKA